VCVIPVRRRFSSQGKWDRKALTGIEMHGKTLGVIGCGRIGQEVAKCAKELGMQVIGYDPVMSAAAFAEAGLQQVELSDIWRQSDFITVHTPLTAETKGLLNAETLMQCKKGALTRSINTRLACRDILYGAVVCCAFLAVTGVRIINCARGGIVDETALLQMLQSGQVGGAALDVFTTEPPGEALRALIAHPNLVCTPHLGASTEEAQINVARDIATQMCDVFDQCDFVGVVNVPYLAASTQVHMKPFMQLAESLGIMQAQLSPSPVTKVNEPYYARTTHR
jgi:D-3-phosphoglycerate dehydrogenase